MHQSEKKTVNDGWYAVEKWGCNEIRVSLFLCSRELFPYLESIHSYSRNSSWDLLVGESARQMRAMGQITKVSVFLQGFTLNAGGTRYARP